MKTKARPAPPEHERPPRPPMPLQGFLIPEATYEAIAEEMRKRESYVHVLVCDGCRDDDGSSPVCDTNARCKCCYNRRYVKGMGGRMQIHPHHAAITRADFGQAYATITGKAIEPYPRAVGKRM